MIRRFKEKFQASIFLKQLPNYITVFGSAKKIFEDNHQFGIMAENVGEALAKADFTVMTGGGPGIMAMVNKGAYKVDPNLSVGCKLNVVCEPPNQYMSRSISTHYLDIRKKVLLLNAHAYVVLPGGYGTLDELFEVITLIKVGLIKEKRPVLLVDTQFWKPLIEFINSRLKDNGIIINHEVNLIRMVDDPCELADILQNRSISEGVYI